MKPPVRASQRQGWRRQHTRRSALAGKYIVASATWIYAAALCKLLSQHPVFLDVDPIFLVSIAEWTTAEAVPPAVSGRLMEALLRHNLVWCYRGWSCWVDTKIDYPARECRVSLEAVCIACSVLFSVTDAEVVCEVACAPVHGLDSEHVPTEMAGKANQNSVDQLQPTCAACWSRCYVIVAGTTEYADIVLTC
jgi:hypothetical protein